LQAEAKIGRSGRCFAENLAGIRAQPRAAAGAAAVNAEQQDFGIHVCAATASSSRDSVCVGQQ
jgi:hypothetical protein